MSLDRLHPALPCGRPAVRTGKVAVLEEFARLRTSDEFAGLDEVVALMAEDVAWSTLYGDIIKGRKDIKVWMETESQAGRKNIDFGPWSNDNAPDRWKRDMKVTFTSKATHDVVQTVTMAQGLIQKVVMKPKYPALGVALAFADARTKQDDEAALEQMSEKVEWKAWDGFHVEGKEGVRKLFHEQKGREVVRQGRTEFEAATVNEQVGIFERILDIERVDGIKVRTKQKLFIKGELTELEPVNFGNGNIKPIWGVLPKIYEVHVLTTEELIEGKWVKSKEDDHW
jgi:hypothetical protein